MLCMRCFAANALFELVLQLGKFIATSCPHGAALHPNWLGLV